VEIAYQQSGSYDFEALSTDGEGIIFAGGGIEPLTAVAVFSSTSNSMEYKYQSGVGIGSIYDVGWVGNVKEVSCFVACGDSGAQLFAYADAADAEEPFLYGGETAMETSVITSMAHDGTYTYFYTSITDAAESDELHAYSINETIGEFAEIDTIVTSGATGEIACSENYIWVPVSGGVEVYSLEFDALSLDCSLENSNFEDTLSIVGSLSSDYVIGYIHDKIWVLSCDGESITIEDDYDTSVFDLSMYESGNTIYIQSVYIQDQNGQSENDLDIFRFHKGNKTIQHDYTYVSECIESYTYGDMLYEPTTGYLIVWDDWVAFDIDYINTVAPIDISFDDFIDDGIFKISFSPYVAILGNFTWGIIFGFIGAGLYANERSIAVISAYLILVGTFFSIILPYSVVYLFGLVLAFVLTIIFFVAFIRKKT